MDLSHETDRRELRAHLGGLYAGRPVLIGPGVLAGFASAARMVREADASAVLILATTRGAGPVPDEEWVSVEAPARATVTEELRDHDRLLRALPMSVVERIEAFDPERRGVWCTTPFISTDEPVLGRPVTGGRPARFEAVEDKLLAEEIWCAAEVEHAPSRVVPADLAALDEASDELGGDVVWSGDTREGFNGGGNYVRWVATAAERAAAYDFFAAHCDRVRVLPFLEGVPCSVHGMVLPDGTAAFRPVEIAILRNAGERAFTYGGLSSYWDPPEVDRAAMRDAVRRVGEHLRAAYGYAGAFGIDGVLTADGFRPTELNARISAGLASVAAAVDRDLFTLVQANLIAGRDPGVTVAELETALPVMDRVRTGRPVAVSEGRSLHVTDSYPLAWDGQRFTRTDEETGNVLAIGDTPTGFFAKVDPCAALHPGERLAPLNAALYAFLDVEYDAGFGPVSPAPSVRH
ncbi:hypothetical protein EKO23_11975 [Nocardioides guangzhouensis]|uniref:ATP-grasp domain-containing protein n=1 Tax=Nocardioides guangzhouensis TaxID=2497878 RepID=A0A4Q4ZCL2_9ACTN|nr:hypothetical protein [Nocardioides guangzhouensis]RYP85712.1 hypothetical protein EKO23_11975 [Nocardioides guangzhouensis]